MCKDHSIGKDTYHIIRGLPELRFEGGAALHIRTNSRKANSGSKQIRTLPKISQQIRKSTPELINE